MTAKQYEIDVTPYRRNPYSGVGRTAYETFAALQRNAPSDSQVVAVSRDRGPRPSRLRPHLYHCFEHKLIFSRSRKVVTIHDLWSLEKNGYQPERYQRRSAPSLTAAIKRAWAIVTPSYHVRAQLTQRFPDAERRTHAIWHGRQLFPEAVTRPASGELSAFLESREPFALTIGCLEARKNQTLLLSALERIDMRLVLVGQPGFGGEAVTQMLSRHPRRRSILHLAHATETELCCLMNECALYIQPSLDEGFGMPVADALGFGKPLVLSDIAVFHEIANDAAIFFDKASADCLRSAIERALTAKHDPRAALARARAFDWNRTAETLFRIYSGT